MRRSLVWSLRVLAGLAAVLGLGLGAGYLWLRGSLPQTDGALRIAALEAPVEVLRDADGIVTIRAENERDAAVALGYVHAQDRLWQMDFMRRTGAGRLSEVAGPATLRLDHFMRALGLYRVAEANLDQLSPPARDLADAYAAGVNAFIEAPGGPWPPEFYLLGYRPEPWRPADSLVWGRLMALQLSGNWSVELLRARLAKRLTPEQVDFLWPAGSWAASAPTAESRSWPTIRIWP
jgi:penicillin amidase